VEGQQNGPIFIVGAPRSGTSLLRNMLNRHPDISMCRETGFFHYVYRRRRAFGDLSEPRNRRRLAQEYLSIQRIQRLRIDLSALRTKLLREATSYEAFFTAMLAFAAQAQGKARFGEKTPHTRFIETLWRWYPDATFIHLLRDPRDVVASLQRMPWASNSVIANARLWLQDNLRALRWRDHPRYLQVRYEKLVQDPEQHLRRVCAAIGAGYAPCMLVPKPDPTADRPWFQRAEKPVTTDRLGQWSKQLPTTQVALIEWAIGSHFDTFEYSASGAHPTRSEIVRGLTFQAFDSVRRWIGEFPGGWLYVTKSTELVREEDAKDRFRFRHLVQQTDS